MKIFFSILFLAISLTAGAQCSSFNCTSTNNVSGSLHNQSYNGDQCFSGTGTIAASTNWNNWNNLSFSGNLNVAQQINFQNGVHRVYIQPGATVTLNAISMDGNDTIYNAGYLTVNSYVANNSLGNVIINAPNATLKIGGVYHYAPDTLRTNANIVVIASCPVALPITIEYFRGNTYSVSWKLDNISEIREVYLQSSLDGIVWDVQESYFMPTSGVYTETTEREYYRLKIEDKDGNIYYSKSLTVNVLDSMDYGIVIDIADAMVIRKGIIANIAMDLPRNRALCIRTTTNIYKVVLTR